MEWTVLAAVLVTAAAVWALAKRYETRLVLFAAGFAMCCCALHPMAALDQFAKSMTQGSLIMAICASLGFAAVISMTGCDAHLVSLLTRPIRRMGFFVLPACMAAAAVVVLAVPSGAGLVAAVGPTLIPILLKSGFKPATACAAVWGSLFLSYYNPGVSHNVFLAKMAGLDVMGFVSLSGWSIGILAALSILFTMASALLFKDYEKGRDFSAGDVKEPERINPLFAFAPLLPVVLLLVGHLWVPAVKMGVAQAMLVGTVYTLAVTRTDPQKAVREFFGGMGRGYGNILGIIIAAGVFAAGLRACGVVDLFVNYLTHANAVARIGALFGPFVLGVLTGSGDAAAFAFNEAVTVHAADFGLTVHGLGMLAVLSAAIGRMASPLAGGLILATGFAGGVSPVEVAKRTGAAALPLLAAVWFLF